MGGIALNIGRPNPKQALFFASRAKYTAYGGARAGGKSWAMRNKFVLLALRYQGLQLLLLRRTLPELNENHIVPLRRMLGGIAKYKMQEKVFIFPNGSRIKLGYCKNEADVLQYQGQAYDVVGLEEATMFTEFQFNCLKESNRSSGMCSESFPPRMYLTCNPGGVGHHWVKRLFIDRNFNGAEKPEDYVFIPARVYDNSAFMEADPDYVHQLETLPDKRRRAMLYGDWDAIEGAFFEEFANNPEGYTTRKLTHVISPFEIPAAWKIYRSYDHGYSKPFSMGYWTVDPDGCIYRIAEFYGCTGNANEGVKWEPDRIFAEARAFERRHPLLADRQISTGVADPSIWDASRGRSVAEAASAQKIYFTPGDNERIAGWMEMRNRFAFDGNGRAMMYIFDTCKNAIRVIPQMIYDDHRVDDLDTDLEDHILDEMRYFCMSRPIKARLPAAPDKTPDPLGLKDERKMRWDDGLVIGTPYQKRQ